MNTINEYNNQGTTVSNDLFDARIRDSEFLKTLPIIQIQSANRITIVQSENIIQTDESDNDQEKEGVSETNPSSMQRINSQKSLYDETFDKNKRNSNSSSQ